MKPGSFRYWLREQWHKSICAPCWRYEIKNITHTYTYWSDWYDWKTARLDLENPEKYTGRMQYDPSRASLPKDNKITVERLS